jgi:pimeloyl-ACP methyl ester carboxylesterase
MRLVYAVLIAAAACSRPVASTIDNHAVSAAVEPTDPDHARAASFQPTAFSVEVRGHGRPIILIPGLGCPSSVWDGMVAHLHGYETHQLSLAGFAGRPRIDAPLSKTTVDELARYIRDRHLQSPVIVGHSLGGSIAYALAAREPMLVGPTIVVDAGAPAATADADTRAAAAQIRDMWSEASDERFAQQVKDIFGQMSVKPERLQPMLAEVAKSDRRAIGDAIYELSTTNMRSALGNIRSPVLLVLADGALQDDFRQQAAGVHNREVVVVRNTGHFVMIDDPEGFFAAVDGFLAKHELLAVE